MAHTRLSAREIGTGEIVTSDIADLSVTDAKIAAANKDGAAATPSMRTLGAGALQAAAGNDARLSDARPPSAHTHGNITSGGLVGTVGNLPLMTGFGGLVQAGSWGSTANTFAQGNDARLSDARTPLAHNHIWANITESPSIDAVRATITALTGGGTITVSAAYDVKWSARFLLMGNGNGAHYSSVGYFDITCPLTGTITGVGGAANKTATAAGIPLVLYEALYYILPIGSGNTSLPANFRVVGYQTALVIPYNWIKICSRSEGNYVEFANGISLRSNTSIDSNLYDSLGADISGPVASATLAASATILQTARTINGVSFNGSANITIADSTKLPLAGGTMSNTTLVANLNADLLDGNHASAFALSGHTHTFASLTSKPTTLSGYGITDALSSSSSHYVGTTLIANNRASAAQTLTGISIDGTSRGLSSTDLFLTHPGNGITSFANQIATGSYGLFPSVDNSNAIISLNRHGGEYNSQLGFSSNGNMYYRAFSNTVMNTTQPWRTVWDSNSLTNINQLSNGPGYITSSALASYLPLAGGTLTGPVYNSSIISVASDGVGHDTVYGKISVTRGTASTFAYFGLVRGGQIGWSLGINTSNDFVIGAYSSSGIINSTALKLSPDGNALFSGSVTATTFIGALQGNATTATNVAWSGITSKPTTISGYGITDAITGTSTSGNIAFWNGTNTQTGSSNLYWNNATNRLGVGINNPTNGTIECYSAAGTSLAFRDANSAVRIITWAGENFIQSGVAFSSTTAPLIFGGMYGASEWMRMHTNGNISIGNSTDLGTGKFQVTGNSSFTGTITASGGFLNSDKRLKDIVSRDGDLVSFTWKDGRDNKKHIGYIAQEVQKIMPDAVQEDSNGMLSVNYIEVLVAKIQDLENRLKKLENGME